MTDRHAAVRRALLESFGIETKEKAFAKIATGVIAVPIAIAVGWSYPIEPWWGKLLQVLGSWVVAMAIIYLWIPSKCLP